MNLLFALWLFSATGDALVHVGGGAIRTAARRSVVMSADPPELSYAADKKPPTEDLTVDSFLGQYEFQEKEDAEDIKTLLELRPDGKLILGATDGIPFTKLEGRWEFYKGEIFVMELIREYDTFSTTRIFLGDIVQFDSTPQTVEGPIKLAIKKADEKESILYHPLPDDSVGFFVATKIPPVPLDV